MWGIFVAGQMVGARIYKRHEKAEECRNMAQDQADRTHFETVFFYVKALEIVE